MKRTSITTLTLTASLLLAACSSSPENENSSSAPQEGGELSIAVLSDPVSFDPHAANELVSNTINTTIYDRLVTFNEDLAIEPSLAESLEQLDETTWEVKIRQDVTFHDGSALTASTVKASLDRVRDPEIGSPVAFLFTMIDDVTVIDEETVHITTAFPFASLPAHLAHPGGSILPDSAIDASYEALEAGDDPFEPVTSNPVGTGYFSYAEDTPGQSVTLERNADYWNEEKAKVDEVTFRVIPEDQTRLAELETGGIDIVFPVNPSDLERVGANSEVDIQQSPSTRLAYVGFNTEVEPFTDPDVRRAIHMAINKEEMLEGVLDGVGTIADGPLAPDVFGYSDSIDTIPYDPDQAKALLAEAGFPDGFEATLLTDDDRERQDVAQVLQSQLAEIGIDLSIEMNEYGTYLERASSGDTEIFLGSWGTVTLDGDYGLYPVFHSSNKGGSGNRSFIENEAIDQLLQQAREEMDETQRLALYEEVQNELASQSPYAYLYYPDLITGVRSNVKGFWQYPSSFFVLRDVTVQ